MAGLMNILRRLFRPRKHKRYAALSGAFVVIGREVDGSKKIQILDISEGGLAFIYTGSPLDLEDEGMLSLLDGDTLCVDKVAFESVSDTALSASYPDEEIRRIGLKFKWLGVLDQGKLKDYIRQNAA
ncbi:MAG: PilZ domain-containing protein [Thermodesulfobacteriota bacterium]